MKKLLLIGTILSTTMAYADLPQVVCAYDKVKIERAALKLNTTVDKLLENQKINKNQVILSAPIMSNHTQLCVTVSLKN